MIHKSLLHYQDKISSGILLFSVFILLRFFTHSKPSTTTINAMSKSRRGTVTPAATGAVIEPCALIVTEGVLVVVVAATDELRVDALVGTAEQRFNFLN